MKLLTAGDDKKDGESTSEKRKDEKVSNQTEQQIQDIETQIQNKKDALPDDPKAKLLAQKAITDLEGRILTLKGSLPDSKTESKLKVLKVKQ